MKTCKFCGAEKSPNEFLTTNKCFDCVREYKKNYRKTHKEEISSYRKRTTKTLSSWYVNKILTGNLGYRKDEITPELIRETRERIIMKRKRKDENFNFNSGVTTNNRLL